MDKQYAVFVINDLYHEWEQYSVWLDKDSVIDFHNKTVKEFCGKDSKVSNSVMIVKKIDPETGE